MDCRDKGVVIPVDFCPWSRYACVTSKPIRRCHDVHSVSSKSYKCEYLVFLVYILYLNKFVKRVCFTFCIRHFGKRCRGIVTS